MQQSWRWFGPNDPVTLEKIVQAGARGVVTSLHHIPTGEAWPLADVLQRKREIEAAMKRDLEHDIRDAGAYVNPIYLMADSGARGGLE